MQEAPVAIVEYDGYLKGEESTDRDNRMEIVDVYDGTPQTLVSYLRHLYPDRKRMTKWALIFQVYSEIIDVHQTIEQAKVQNVFGASGESGEAPVETEVVQSDPVASKEETLTADDGVTDVTPEQTVHTDTVETGSPTPIEEFPVKEAEPSANRGDALDTQVADDSSLTPSGNVREGGGDLLSNTTLTEVKRMSDVNELLQAAAGAQASANPAEAQKAPSANTGAVKADMKAAQVAVSQALASESAQRQAWTKSNFVTSLVSTMKPAALRRTSDEGTVGTETDPAKQQEAINGKLTGFVAAVTGKKGLTVEQFEALSDNERYVNVVPGTTKVNDVEVSNVDKAKAIYELLKQVKQNPNITVPAFIPGKLSYPVKGYAVGGKAMPTDEFMVLMLDKSNGAIYATGGVDANGNEIDGATSFKLATAKKTEKAQAQAITTQRVERRVPVIRVKAKAAFIEGGKNIIYLFNNEDPENAGRAAFRAAISVNGVMVGAGVTVYALDDEGKRQVLSHNDKDNTDRYKTKQASVSVSVPVKKVIKEFAPEFKGEDDTLIAAARWGVPMGSSKTQNGDFCNIKEFSQTPAFDVFAQVYAGQVQFTGKLKESTTLQTLRAAANKAAEEDAAEAAEALA